jgi:homoserine O-acetyltransferase
MTAATTLLVPRRPPAYELTGHATAPITLVLGGISASRHVTSSAEDPAPGWWQSTVGEGRAIDTCSRRVLGVDYLDGGRRRDGRPAIAVTTHDQAAAIVALLDALGIARVEAVVGASYGGMVALALGERWPARVGRLVVVSAAHEPHPLATAHRSIQRRIVDLGLATGRAEDAMGLARALAMTTYRSRREFASRFATTAHTADAEVRFDVEQVALHGGERFARRMPPARFLALSLSADLHRVVPEQIAVAAVLIAARGDALVPISQMRALARRLPGTAALHVMRSRLGHDAFLAEPAGLAPLLTSALGD